MDRSQLLLVEPDEDEASALSTHLRAAGFRVDIAPDAARALAVARATSPECVVTEFDLPGLSGTELCRRLRAEPATHLTPIVVLSRRASEIDRVVAFEVGADDYVLKPYFPRELSLRIRARIRRVAAPPPPADVPIRMGSLEIDRSQLRVSADGEAVPLTVTEIELIAAIARRGGGVVSRATLLREVWDLPEGAESRTLDTHVRRLREKLGPYADLVQTVRGVGYRFVDNSSGARTSRA